MKIGTRLFGAFMALIILLMVVGSAGFAITQDLNHTKETITEHAHLMDDVNNLSANLMYDHMMMIKYINLMENDSKNQELLEEIKMIDENTESILEHIGEHLPVVDVSLEESIIFINVQIAKSESIFDEVVEKKENNTFNMTMRHNAPDEIYDPYYTIFFGQNYDEDEIGLDFISLSLINKINAMESEANEQEDNIIWIGAVGIILGIFLVIFMGIYITRSIVKPVKRLVKGAENIRNGNFDNKVPEEGNDEIYELTVMFNEMAKSLKEGRDIKEEINGKLNEAISKLERSNKELQEFAYVAAHDLQEPLRMVVSYLQLLERRYKEQLDSEAEEFMDFAIDGAIRMQQLINDLLVYSRVETKGRPFETTDSESVLETTIANLKVAIEESGAQVTYENLPEVMVDSSQIVQLFQNLIGNAIKFRGEGGPHIHISAKKKGKEWLFSVRDNGIGIEPEFSERIFTMFQRLHSKDQYSGTGIGLAVCKKIVQRHGGSIWVESTSGKGSIFYFTIPRRIDEDSMEKNITTEARNSIKEPHEAKIDTPLWRNNPERTGAGAP